MRPTEIRITRKQCAELTQKAGDLLAVLPGFRSLPKEEIVEDLRKKKNGFVFLSKMAASVAVILMFLVTASPAQSSGPASAQNRAGVGASGTDGAVDKSAVNTFTEGGFGSTSQAPREVNLGALPEATLQQLTAPRVSYRPLDGLTDAQHSARKEQARQRAKAGLVGAKSALGANLLLPEGLGTAGPEGLAPTLIKLSPRFAAYQQSGGGTPPDMALAVSEKFVVQFVNNAISVYDKLGNLQQGFPKSSCTFFKLNPNPCPYTTDPRGFYDWTYHRFVFIMLTESNPNNPSGPANVGGLLIAASQTADPTGLWYVYPAYNIGNPGECPDFPTLGHDSNNWGTGATEGGVYVGTNQFGTLGYCSSPPNPAPGFIGNYFFMIAKDGLYTGAAFAIYTKTGASHGGTLVDTLQAANMTVPADKPSSVLMVISLNINFDGSSGLVAWSVSNPFGWITGAGAPVFTGVNVSTGNYSFPPGADEPNGSGGICTGCIATGDSRISGSVMYHAGELFGSLNTAVSGSPAPSFLWFDVHEILNANGNVTSAYERQEDCLFCGVSNPHNASYYYATLQPDTENNLIMVYDFSSDLAFPSMGYASRRVNHGDGLIAAIGLVFSGTAFYHEGCDSSGQNCRWGDYTATAPGLLVPTFPTMWFSGQYANASGNWGTGIAAGKYVRPTDQ
jgi:hypothetical protein